MVDLETLYGIGPSRLAEALIPEPHVQILVSDGTPSANGGERGAPDLYARASADALLPARAPLASLVASSVPLILQAYARDG